MKTIRLLWDFYFSGEENCTDISEFNEDDIITGKWWPREYPESEATKLCLE